MLSFNLAWIWLALAIGLIWYSVRSSRKFGEGVLERIAEENSDETTEDLPFWSVKFAFGLGTTFFILFFLSVLTLVLQKVSQLGDVGAVLLNGMLGG